jgi:hypothetical protein
VTMVWSKQATVVLALTALVVMSIVIVPVAIRSSQNNRESSLSASTDGQENEQTISRFPSYIPSSAPPTAPTSTAPPSSAPPSTAPPSSVPTIPRLGSDFPSRIPSGGGDSDESDETTIDLPSDIPSSTPSDIPSSAPSDVQTSVPTNSVQQPELKSDFPSMVPSPVPTAHLSSDYPSIVPSSWGTPAPTVNTKREVAPSSSSPSTSDPPSLVPSAQPSEFVLRRGGLSSSPSTSDPPSLVPSAQPSEYVFRRGGTIVAIAGYDYTIMATDGATGLTGPLVLGEDVTRFADVTDTNILASSGCKSGVDLLITLLTIRKNVCR